MRSNSDYYPCDYNKACHVLWAVQVEKWSQTKTALAYELNVGTVNHIVHRRRFETAIPVPPPRGDN